MHTPRLKRATCRLNEETKGPFNRENTSEHVHPTVVYHGYMPQNTTLGRVPGCEVTSYPSLCPLWKVKTMDTRLVCQLKELSYVQVSVKTAWSVCGCKCTTFFPHVKSVFYQYQGEEISSFPPKPSIFSLLNVKLIQFLIPGKRYIQKSCHNILYKRWSTNLLSSQTRSDSDTPFTDRVG